MWSYAHHLADLGAWDQGRDLVSGRDWDWNLGLEGCTAILLFIMRRELLNKGTWQNIDYIICDTKTAFSHTSFSEVMWALMYSGKSSWMVLGIKVPQSPGWPWQGLLLGEWIGLSLPAVIRAVGRLICGKCSTLGQKGWKRLLPREYQGKACILLDLLLYVFWILTEYSQVIDFFWLEHKGWHDYILYLFFLELFHPYKTILWQSST